MTPRLILSVFCSPTSVHEEIDSPGADEQSFLKLLFAQTNNMVTTCGEHLLIIKSQIIICKTKNLKKLNIPECPGFCKLLFFNLHDLTKANQCQQMSF